MPPARPNVSPARLLAAGASVFLSLPLAQPDLPPGGRYARGAATPARVVPSAAGRAGRTLCPWRRHPTGSSGTECL